MKKINIYQLRILHAIKKDYYIISSCNGDILAILYHNTFEGFQPNEINRENIREAFKLQGLDTHKWEYFTNEYGQVILNI
jgi:hypothetical protein